MASEGLGTLGLVRLEGRKWLIKAELALGTSTEARGRFGPCQ